MFPLTRQTSIERSLEASEETAQEQGIDMEQRRENATKAWLEYLEYVKREKDKNSLVWGKMLNWD